MEPASTLEVVLSSFIRTVTLVFTAAVALMGYASVAFAHNAPVDELGCHVDPSTGGYHCLSGPLMGQDFTSKEEAQTVLAHKGKDGEEATPRSSEVNERLNVVSWRLKKGVAKVDHDRIASVLATADIALLQNVEFSDKGDTPLMVVATVLEKRTNEKICKGWFKNAKGERGHYAFIWRERVIGFVEKNGEMKETCSGRPVVIRTETGKEPGTATFFLKSNRKLFVLTSVSFDEAPKEPVKEVTPLFRNYSDTGWGFVFAGDLKTAAKSPALAEVKKWKFKPAMTPSKSKRGQDNFWFKNLSLITAQPVNLFEQFPEVAATELFSNVSDSFPIRAEFSFSEKEAEAIQTQMISKKKGKGPASTKAAVVAPIPEAFPPPLKSAQMSNLNEDIEGEAGAIEHPKPVKTAGKKLPKKKKSK